MIEEIDSLPLSSLDGFTTDKRSRGMAQRIWMKKATSFAEARDQDLDYYLKMSAQERLEIVQYLREQYAEFAGKNANESGKGLRRTVSVVQQA